MRMLSCKEVSYLASQKLDQNLTRWERVGLFFHLSMCGVCRGYGRDLMAIREKLRAMGATEETLLSTSVTLPEQSRERIKEAMGKALQNTET